MEKTAQIRQSSPKTTRKITAPEERKQFVDDWLKSGLSKTAFAKLHNINAHVFYNWTSKYLVHKKSISKTSPQLLPVKPSTNFATHSAERRMEILVNKQCIIRFPMPSTTQAIIELVRGLSPCN
jgi:transposase-like protein